VIKPGFPVRLSYRQSATMASDPAMRARKSLPAAFFPTFLCTLRDDMQKSVESSQKRGKHPKERNITTPNPNFGIQFAPQNMKKRKSLKSSAFSAHRGIRRINRAIAPAMILQIPGLTFPGSPRLSQQCSLSARLRCSGDIIRVTGISQNEQSGEDSFPRTEPTGIAFSYQSFKDACLQSLEECIQRTCIRDRSPVASAIFPEAGPV
jgi:hypothetical protein